MQYMSNTLSPKCRTPAFCPTVFPQNVAHQISVRHFIPKTLYTNFCTTVCLQSIEHQPFSNTLPQNIAQQLFFLIFFPKMMHTIPKFNNCFWSNEGVQHVWYAVGQTQMCNVFGTFCWTNWDVQYFGVAMLDKLECATFWGRSVGQIALQKIGTKRSRYRILRHKYDEKQLCLAPKALHRS